jgi:CheY-like chemotaxis protein
MQTIIHVDNSEFFRRLVKTFLIEQGFLVESFSKGAKALEAIDGDTDLIITGMSLSDMDGEDFIKKIIGSPYNIPIITLTSNQSVFLF